MSAYPEKLSSSLSGLRSVIKRDPAKISTLSHYDSSSAKTASIHQVPYF